MLLFSFFVVVVFVGWGFEMRLSSFRLKYRIEREDGVKKYFFSGLFVFKYYISIIYFSQNYCCCSFFLFKNNIIKKETKEK